MNGFRVLNFALFAFCFLCTIKQLESTCVFDSDFGLILNCAFKKSGLFRVRNLGGVKAHFGLGFSVGDELGLTESLGNVEANKRRALNIRTNANNIGVLPASKMPTSYPPVLQPLPPQGASVPPGALGGLLGSGPAIQQSRPQAVTLPRGKPPVKSIGGLPKVPSSASPVYVSPAASQMTKATSLPLGVPPFRPIPKPAEPEMPSQLMNQTSSYHRTAGTAGTSLSRTPGAPPNQQIIYKEAPHLQVQKVPAFQAMPESVSRISTGPVVQIDNKLQPAVIKNSIMSIPPRRQSSSGKPSYPSTVTASAADADATEGVDLMGHTVEELAAAANVSVEVIKEAIRVRQQELRAQKQYERQQAAYAQAQFLAAQQTTTTTTTTTTTPRPRRYPTNVGHKVMNAPKEYYPVGYDKNFDDNFTSKVDLPHTTFNCGEQKHFPGLYGDEDLGCMVFHVCALTDDGLIMKSFLCPESTLFDQTVLKCNWWFYVDCKSSKNLYDSNLPVSKSYQLMKALSFFSSNYKNTGDSAESGVDVEALKNSVATAVAVGGSARSLDNDNSIAGSTGETEQRFSPPSSASTSSSSSSSSPSDNGTVTSVVPVNSSNSNNNSNSSSKQQDST
ncbi:SH3 domain-containing protein C23A1.17-like isoform X2 [Anopheles albimanus]|uniref:SH3 domain-containing protein C23A1.17-like isoform X2 n=1 Tax=Anopheles albimanus TaxID=7167 RepID=UPI00163E1CBF|nr:SH3 domain-containing protein C23A1.17-like isoform X2 [Anopheles albimanus]